MSLIKIVLRSEKIDFFKTCYNLDKNNNQMSTDFKFKIVLFLFYLDVVELVYVQTLVN